MSNYNGLYGGYVGFKYISSFSFLRVLFHVLKGVSNE